MNIVFNSLQMLSIGFYFSYSYDLTLSQSKKSQNCAPSEYFNWTSNLFNQMINQVKMHNRQKVVSGLRIQLIQGFVGEFQYYVFGKKIQMVLVSRRANKRAGTRYNSRGQNYSSQALMMMEMSPISVKSSKSLFTITIYFHISKLGEVYPFFGNKEESKLKLKSPETQSTAKLL